MKSELIPVKLVHPRLFLTKETMLMLYEIKNIVINFIYCIIIIIKKNQDLLIKIVSPFVCVVRRKKMELQ